MKNKIDQFYIYFAVLLLLLANLFLFPKALNNREIIMNDYSNFIINQGMNGTNNDVNSESDIKINTPVKSESSRVFRIKCNSECSNNCLNQSSMSELQFKKCLISCNCDYSKI